MRKVCVLVCCVLIFLAMMMVTSADAKNLGDKKNKKPAKNDPFKDKSTKSESRKEKQPDVNPKMRELKNRKEKTKQEQKIKNDSTEIPVITANKVDVGHQHEVKRQPDVKDLVLNTLAENVVTKNCSDTLSKSDQLEAIEKNVTSLWRHLRVISQPVHVHIHGGQVSSSGCHGKSGCQGGCQADRSRKGHHNEQKDSHPLSDKQKHHGHSHNNSHDHSHSHSHKHKDSDKSHPHNTTAIGSHNHTHHGHGGHKSHHHVKHHSKSHSHTHHGRGDRSHKSHHHCKNHTKSHNHTHHGRGDRSHKSHHHSKHHHGHHGDHSHKSHHHSKHHSHGHKLASGRDASLSKGHYHKGGYGYGDRSTHVHIHLTIDGQLPAVRQEINQSEPTSTVPITNDTHTHTPEQIFGRCDFPKNSLNHNLVGYVLLRQGPSGLDVAVNISGFQVSADDADHPGNKTQDPGPRTHGFHVHEFGDFSKGCLSFGSHYNPEGTTHGGPHHHARSDIWHVGDWGNIEANDQGRAVSYFSVSDATLQGPHSILGRGIVVHEHADDLGEGGMPASKTTGNAGGRQACCIIGHSKPLPAESFQPAVDPSDPTPETVPTTGS